MTWEYCKNKLCIHIKSRNLKAKLYFQKKYFIAGSLFIAEKKSHVCFVIKPLSCRLVNFRTYKKEIKKAASPSLWKMLIFLQLVK